MAFVLVVGFINVQFLTYPSRGSATNKDAKPGPVLSTDSVSLIHSFIQSGRLKEISLTLQYELSEICGDKKRKLLNGEQLPKSFTTSHL